MHIPLYYSRNCDNYFIYAVGMERISVIVRVLVLTITAGEGHNHTAAAIKEGIESRGVECRLVDVYKLLSETLYKAFSEGYLFATKYLKRLYGDFYYLAENRGKDANQSSPMRKANSSFAKMLSKYVSTYDPDVIIYTHVFAGVLLDEIKVKYGLRATTMGIVTDFRLHPYWEENLHLDYVVCADKRLMYNAMQKGFKKSQLLPFGIPIHPKFLKEIPKDEARKELGLENKRTVLVMGGSMGFGDITENVQILDALDVDFQIMVVCGSNKKLCDELSKMEFSKTVKVFGYVNNVELLMSASDCIVTKPGGLTTSESLAKRIPLIIVNPIPGQEDRNVEFLLNNGAAIATSKHLKLDEAIWICFSDEKRLESLREAISQIRHPDALDKICDFAIERVKENYEIKRNGNVSNENA